ncbi:hypothetical protein, partial [Acinetobacter baumannii]|uniref:hypothetical protein n=1 Tax=Acinetobacter baumannii TaxID=470 RepID=UPI001BC86F72
CESFGKLVGNRSRSRSRGRSSEENQSGKMFINKFRVQSPNVKYSEESIESVYDYQTTELVHENRDGNYEWVVKPKSVKYEFKTDTRLPKLGVMLVGWGGNNGST